MENKRVSIRLSILLWKGITCGKSYWKAELPTIWLIKKLIDLKKVLASPVKFITRNFSRTAKKPIFYLTCLKRLKESFRYLPLWQFDQVPGLRHLLESCLDAFQQRRDSPCCCNWVIVCNLDMSSSLQHCGCVILYFWYYQPCCWSFLKRHWERQKR